jgi:hypothetical protein
MKQSPFMREVSAVFLFKPLFTLWFIKIPT